MIYFIIMQIFHENHQNSCFFFKIRSRITGFLLWIISNTLIVFTASFWNMHNFKRRYIEVQIYSTFNLKFFLHFLRSVMLSYWKWRSRSWGKKREIVSTRCNFEGVGRLLFSTLIRARTLPHVAAKDFGRALLLLCLKCSSNILK